MYYEGKRMNWTLNAYQQLSLVDYQKRKLEDWWEGAEGRSAFREESAGRMDWLESESPAMTKTKGNKIQ